SVIFNPVRDELFTAQRGAGATLNGETIRVGDAETLEGVRLLASDGIIRKPIWTEPWPPYTAMKVNSLAYRLALVACGRADAAFATSPKREWDIAAGAVVVQAAGGLATGRVGAPLIFNKPVRRVHGFLAAGKKCHAMLVDRLTTGLKETLQGKR